MARIAVALLGVGIIYLIVLLLGSGYYLNHCSCSFDFFFFKSQYDCQKICTIYQPMTTFQKSVNALLLESNVGISQGLY